jgi:nucleotide-binding universal stress UspA family protein
VDPQAYDDAHAELNAALLELAKSLCETERCELMIAHIWNFFGEQLLRSRLTPRQVEELRAQERSNAEQSLGALVFQHELLVDSNKIILREGDPQVVIPELVAEKGIDLLIMGTVARGGVSGFMMGNTAETVVNRVNCSILALKPRTFVSSIRLEDEHHESVTIF